MTDESPSSTNCLLSVFIFLIICLSDYPDVTFVISFKHSFHLCVFFSYAVVSSDFFLIKQDFVVNIFHLLPVKLP